MLRTAAALYSLLLTAGVLGARVRRDDAYGAPEAPSYHEPEESYGAPDTSYSAPAYSAPGETGLDLTTLLIPLLALVGLFLLFPTYVTLTSVRRKREAGDENAEVNMVERIADMYQVRSKLMRNRKRSEDCNRVSKKLKVIPTHVTCVIAGYH